MINCYEDSKRTHYEFDFSGIWKFDRTIETTVMCFMTRILSLLFFMQPHASTHGITFYFYFSRWYFVFGLPICSLTFRFAVHLIRSVYWHRLFGFHGLAPSNRTTNQFRFQFGWLTCLWANFIACLMTANRWNFRRRSRWQWHYWVTKCHTLHRDVRYHWRSCHFY